jgi:peptide chain release factor subunit 1
MALAMTPTHPFLPQLDRLAELEPVTAPFISLYLNAQPNERGRDNFGVFLKKELSGRAGTYAADSAARASLERDVDRIEAYLASELKPSANGVAIFACSDADGFFEAMQFEVPIDEHQLVIGDRPHLYPLAKIDARYPRAAAVLCDTNRARIMVFAGPVVEAEHEVTGTKTRRSQMGGWSQARYQRHIENFHEQPVKEVVETLSRIVRDEEIPRILLFGDAVVVPMLRQELGPALLEKVIDTSNLPTGSHETVVVERVLEALNRHDAADDREKVDALFDAYRSGGLGVVGVKETLKALEMGQVDELLLSGSLPPEAAAVSDDLVAKARQTSAGISIIEDPALLANAAGVGALLRFRVPGIQKPPRRSRTVGAL